MGTLRTEAGKPVEYATVSLLQVPDSVLVQGTLGSEAGTYVLARPKPGQYVLKITAMGFKNTTSPAFVVGAAPAPVVVPILMLSTASYALEAVTVTTTRPLVERQADRLVVNVAGSVLAAGNNALDVLQKSPGITVDQDGNISLNGKPGATVMLNDKLTYLSATQLATLLRSTDGNTIQSIELIANPSAKYDAAGNAGLINIKLKQTRQSGTNGSLVLGVGQGYYLKDNGSLTLNHRAGKFNVFGTLSHLDVPNQVQFGTRRTLDSAGYKTYFTQAATVRNTERTNSYRAGVDYDFSARHTAGVIVSGYANTETNGGNALAYVGTQPGVVSSYQNTLSQVVQTFHNIALNLNDRLQLDTLGQKLSLDLDYARFTNASDEEYSTAYYLADGSRQSTSTYLHQQTPSEIEVRTAKADYAYPVTKALLLEAGAKLSDVRTDNELAAQTSTDGQIYVRDATLSNHFSYTERIQAAYLNLARTYAATTLRAGLRTERTSSVGSLLASSEPPVMRRYLDLFPSLFIDHTFSPKHQLGLSVSRRIDRPGYGNLNPFIYYIDRYTRVQGNPLLRPQYTTKVELLYTFAKTLGVSVGYSRTTDVNAQVILSDTATKLSAVTRINLPVLATYSLNLNTPFILASWWTSNINGTLTYRKYTSDLALESTLPSNPLSYSVKAGQNFRVGSAYKLELLAQYRSPQVGGLNIYKSSASVDAGVSRAFAQDKVQLKLSISDIFNSTRGGVEANYRSSQFDGYQKFDTRITRLTLIYNFGNNKLKTNSRRTGAEDEKDRINRAG